MWRIKVKRLKEEVFSFFHILSILAFDTPDSMQNKCNHHINDEVREIDCMSITDQQLHVAHVLLLLPSLLRYLT